MKKGRKKSLVKKYTKEWFRKHIKFDCGENGVVIWVDGTWILDASCFNDEFTFEIATDKLKNAGIYGTHQIFALKTETYK
jgi:hypothetical protein